MSTNINKTIMQYFEWYIKPEENLWQKVISEANYIASLGITGVWLPPAYKGSAGINDVGYGVYDLYDLGEFDQKGTIRTKYGTKEEYLEAIRVLKANGIKVIADIVFNHKTGADEAEEVIAIENNQSNRNIAISEPKTIKAWTKFNFDGRNNKYSDFKWNWQHFHGVDWDELTQKKSIFQFYGKHWDNDVDKENGNFDYLMGCDVDLNNVDVVEELIRWGKWYINTTNVDAFRIDAAKHVRTTFFKQWLSALRSETEHELFSVGEYWIGDVHPLLDYLKTAKDEMSLFDVPLHFNFYNASNSDGFFDMRTIFDGTLVKEKPESAVTFVNNHDTEPDQPMFSHVREWFWPLAYALILLRKDGIPCIFYGDYYGIKEKNIPGQKEQIEKLLKLRQHFAYGTQIDYFDHNNIIAWVREGDYEHTDSGLVVIMSDGPGGSKQINVGERLANTYMIDYLGNVKETVYVDSKGNGIFYCDGGSVSVWVKKDNMYDK